MKVNAKRIISGLLVLCMCIAILFQGLPAVKAVSPTYSVSSAYAASSYYSSLQAVELTGNQRDDIINVALSQAGYHEGSYNGDTGGANDGSYSNYTEYNYWYNNYVNSGMPVGGEYAPWCATFVSWCAEQANIPTSIIQRSTAAGCSSYSFNLYFYAGGSSLNSSSDNNYHFLGYNYTPKKGDLFFTRSWSHVGLVVDSDGTYVTTVEGNTNDGGSAEGCGVFVRTRYVDDLYFGVPEYVESYVGASCTYYPAHCQISINSSTPINTQPCSISTANKSENLGTALTGEVYTATGLYCNSYGNYWYRIESDYDETAYLYAGDTTYLNQITSDITLSGASAPEAHVSGNTFTVSGTIASSYNRLDTAACYIYPGFDQSSEATTGYSVSVGGTQYVLNNSTVDYNTSFGSLTSGKYTYEISTKYTNYYATSNTSIASNSGTIRLLSEYFVVIPSSVSQSTCAHSFSTTTLTGATCTAGGTAIKSCSICGLVSETATSASGHSYSGWTVQDATCTTSGTQTRTCQSCGHTETQTIPATGHDYDMVTHAATCNSYEAYEFTCGNCGDNYKLSAGELASGWIDYLPAGMNSSLFRTKTQYRYSDYQTTTSYETSLVGYTQTGSEWVESGSGSVEYVPSWPSGFSTSSSLYSQYSNRVVASETETIKTTVGAGSHSGYLYYHWCSASDSNHYSYASQSSTHTIFHAYYSTSDPSNYNCDESDMSYKTSSSACPDGNSAWFFVTDVYAQEYTTYNKLFTYERWTDYSNWSDTAVTASSSRKVETRTVYQLKNAPALGNHLWSNGKCSACGATCSHNWSNNVCTICAMGCAHNWVNGTCSTCGTICGHSYSGGICTQCGEKEPAKDYYLFGYINGANYACDEDYSNLGTYKFVNGKLTATFASDSYVAVKASNNQDWYMTNGWLGYEATSATLYHTSTLADSNKLFVPGGIEVTFTLVDNGDNTFTLSYVSAVTEPTITAHNISLSFEDDIFMNIYFSASNLDSVTEMGVMTWSSAQTTGTAENAENIIPGYSYNAEAGYYQGRTQGIPAKKLGDTVYFKVYAQLKDGTYRYTKLYNYSPKTYATNTLSNPNKPAELKALVVAMLNYGAAAQTYFGYKPYSLANSSLTTEQKAMVSSYSSSMVSSVTAADKSKVGIFTNSGGFNKRSTSVSFDSAFAINYYFDPTYVPDGSIIMYYWTQEDYNAATTLTPSNATGKVVMSDSSLYKATVPNIAAKDIDGTVYIAAGYVSGGTSYCTGVLVYSLGTYCVSKAATTDTIQPLAAATAVYGYYAKGYFFD